MQISLGVGQNDISSNEAIDGSARRLVEFSIELEERPRLGVKFHCRLHLKILKISFMTLVAYIIDDYIDPIAEMEGLIFDSTVNFGLLVGPEGARNIHFSCETCGNVN